MAEEGCFPRVHGGCEHGRVEDCVGGEQGPLEGEWELAGNWALSEMQERDFSQSSDTLHCPPMEMLKIFEAGGRGGGGKWLPECLCLSILIPRVSSALTKLKQGIRDSGFDGN